MTEIPEDIIKAAETAYLNPECESSPMIIARAILAERERCAEYARAYLQDIAGCDMADDEPEQIAAGIMTGEKFVPPPIDFPEGGKE